MAKKRVKRVQLQPIDTTGAGPATPELALAGHAVQGLQRDLEALWGDLRLGRVATATEVQIRLQNSWNRWVGGYQALMIELGRQAVVLSREPLTSETDDSLRNGD